MLSAEYHKLAEVEDQMWYFRALHAHAEFALTRTLGAGESGVSDRPAELLDAGCGAGGLIRRLSAAHARWRWTGVDLSPLACELTRVRVGADARIIEASITALPLADASQDAVTSLDVIYHVEDDNAALREFFRILRPGGVAVINVPAYPWLWSYHDVATHAKRRYRRRALVEQLRAAGFTAVTATHWNCLPFPLVVVRRKLLPVPAGGSDVRLYPAPIEAVFRAAMGAESAWWRLMGGLPWGSSIFAVARKPTG